MIIIIIIIIILLLESFLYQGELMVFNWSVSKFPLVLMILLSNQTDLNDAVVWIISSRPPVFYYFNLLIKSLETVPSALIAIGISFTFMVHSYF